LYTRHLYLLMIGAVAAVFLLLRRFVLWELALVISCVYVTYSFWAAATPSLPERPSASRWSRIRHCCS
jgi:hypothetical protein